MTLFKEVKTVGALRDLLANLPDDAILFQADGNGGGYKKQLLVLNLDKTHASFDSWHRYINYNQRTEDKIKGTYKNLENIVIFGS